MQLSVERLRWGLLAGGLLLVAVLLVLMGYGRYHAVEMWRRIVARSGATITHETNGFTYSQNVAGRTIFTLHAAKAVPYGDGKYTLHDAVLILYGQKGDRTDRIYGADFDYDQKTQVARALGEVHMDLQPPEGLTGRGTAQGGSGPAAVTRETNMESPETIHVRTSGLVYVRKLGVAATDQDVEIAYQGFVGHSRGAEFDSGQSVVHLLHDVRVNGNLRGQPMTMTAAKADLDQEAEVMTLAQPIIRSEGRMRSAGRTASAATAVVHLRKDGSVEQVHASGDVVFEEGTRSVHAAVMDAAMSTQSLLEHAEFPSGATVDDRSSARPMHGTARSMRIVCDSAGEPVSVVAAGSVTGEMEQRAAGGQTLHRQMAAERVVLGLKRGGRGRPMQVSEIDATGIDATGNEATGGAWMRGESPASGAKRGLKTTEVAGDELKLMLGLDGRGKDEPQMLTGVGRTRLEQRTQDGAGQSSVGDALEVRFTATGAAGGANGAGAGGLQIASAEQTGHVSLRSVPAVVAGAKEAAEVTTGTAQRATYDGESDVMTLYGRPLLERGGTNVMADTITVAEGSGDAVAQGAVKATFVSAKAAPGAEATHATSATALLHRAADTIEFRGTDARPARLWRGASQLEAASVVLDRAHDTLMARPATAKGLVHAVFASMSSGAAGKGRGVPRAGGAQVMRVASTRLDYTGGSREAVFSGGVHAEGATGDVRAARGVAFLKPAAASGTAKGERDLLGGSLDRIVLNGDVRMEQPGRHGTGEQLLYTAATREFVLTGAPGRPAHVVDAQQGSLTGATLVFGSADKSVVVAGEPGVHGQARGRVHTETQMKP
jgi:lipopolysaccharide export system protein LptA